MISSFDAINLLTSKKISYEKIFSHKDFISKISESPRFLNIIIPVKGRVSFARPCIAYIKRSLQESNLNANIVIVENDIIPRYSNICISEHIDYIFIPTDISCSSGQFAKSLCFNVAFLKEPSSEWYLFHDLDILVNNDFFYKLKGYIDRGSTWIQPYQKRRVMRLGDQATNNIILNGDTLYNLATIEDVKASRIGSPGGSIAVKHNDFLKVGGFDPELFFGYSCEDSFFWVKLELIYKTIKGFITSHFQGSATYADDPPIDVYHMNHPCLEGSNPHHFFMIDFLQSFYAWTNEERMRFINEKYKLLQEQKDKVYA